MTRETVLAIGTVLLIVLVRAHAQAPQQPAPSFRVDVRYVDVDVTVTDEQGNVVTGLTQDDFELFEDGKPQTIQTFSFVDVPFREPERFLGVDERSVSTDARSNRRPVSGRMYVIVLDDLDVSFLRTDQVKRDARLFVEEYFGVGDIAAVVHTSGGAGASQDFTSDPQLLLASIEKFLGRKQRSMALEKADQHAQAMITKAQMGGASASDAQVGTENQGDAQSQSSGQNQGGAQNQSNPQQQGGQGTPADPRGPNSMVDLSDFERSHRAIGVLDTLKSLAALLSDVRGRRKALVMFSEGIDYTVTDPFRMSGMTDVLRATQDAINVAARSNVNFYTIDPRGLVGATSEFMGMRGSGLPEAGTPVALMDELQVSQDSLRTLAEDTGGFAALNSNSFASAFERIVERNSRYYVLGYYEPDHPRDGRFHIIDVRVKRPGLRAVARRGYGSPRNITNEELKREESASRARDARRREGDTTSDELRNVLDNPLPQSGLHISVHAAPFKNTDKAASVALAIEIDGETLLSAVPAVSGAAPNKLELSFFAIDANGKASAGTRKELDLRFTRQMSQRIAAHGIRFNPRIAVEPGRYQMRIGVRESAGGTTGSVFYDLIVPDFRKESLAMSGLLLTSVSAQRTPTAEPDPLVAKLLPGAATSRREFPVGDTVAAYAELYGTNSSREPREIDVSLRLVSERGEERFASKDTIRNRARQSERWNIGGTITLEDLPPGRYLLRVEAQLHGDDPASVARETLITVVP
jgi:VWFA-related protein